MAKYSIIFTTFADKKSAKKIIKKLLEKKLAACIQVDSIESFYLWKGKVENENEKRAVIKIKAKHYEKVEKLIQKHHPYDVPQIIEVELKRGLKEYFNWIDTVTVK